MGQTTPDAFLLIDGPDCKGDSTQVKDQHNVWAWSQDITYSGSRFWDKGHTAEISLSGISCLIPCGKATAKLMEHASAMEPLNGVTLQTYETVEGKRKASIKIIGEGVRIGRIAIANEKGGERGGLPENLCHLMFFAKKWKWEIEGGTKGEFDLTKAQFS